MSEQTNTPAIKAKWFRANERWFGYDYVWPDGRCGRNWGPTKMEAEKAMLKTLDHMLGAGNYYIQPEGEKPFTREPCP